MRWRSTRCSLCSPLTIHERLDVGQQFQPPQSFVPLQFLHPGHRLLQSLPEDGPAGLARLEQGQYLTEVTALLLQFLLSQVRRSSRTTA